MGSHATRIAVIVALLLVLAPLNGCYWRAEKGIMLPHARPLPERGYAPLLLINNSDRPLFFYRAARGEAFELVIPPRGHWRIPDLTGDWALRFTRTPVHLPRLDVDEQVKAWPSVSRLRFEERWEYTAFVDETVVHWSMQRFVYPAAKWDTPVE